MNVVICDDHRVFGESLAIVLQSQGHNVVAYATDPAEAVAAVKAHSVDACLMDLNFPTASGIDGIQGIREHSPHTKVVVLSAYVDDAILKTAIDAGAAWCAVKSGDLGQIVEGIAAAVEGGPSMASETSPSDADIVSLDTWSRDPLARFLTSREREVLEGLARGESTAGLARALDVSSATVRTHVQSMLYKLGVHSRLEAVAFAVSRGLFSPSSSPRRQRDAV